MKVDLVKIVENVWNEEDLHNGFSKIAALTCLQRLEEQTNQRVIEELESVLISHKLISGALSPIDQIVWLISDVVERVDQLRQE